MFGRHTRLAALSASALSVLVLAGCGAGDVDTTPPAAMAGSGSADAPELMGAPPAPDAASAPDGLLGAPTPVPPPAPVTTDAMSDKSSSLKTWRRPDGTLVTAMRPIPNPAKERRAVRYAPHAASAPANRAAATPVAQAAKPAAKPVAVAQTPALKPVMPIKPAETLAKAPTPVIAPAAAKPATKLERLQAAIAPDATKGAVLAAGESLSKGEAGQVTLSLPATLGDMIKEQAAKLGLGKAAKTTSAYATLEGQGYEVTPNGKQTAVVKPGEPTTFAWQVKPGADAQGQLQSEFGVELNGAKPAQSFSLGEIAKRVAPVKEQVQKKTDGLLARLNLPGLDGDVMLPGLGQTPMKSVLGGALVLLAVIILAIISRSAASSRAKAERRRKFRTLTDYGRNEMEPDAAPSTAHVSYVNPMVAAAAGAGVGAVAATAVSHGHDDHGHDAHAHAHDDHGHEAHGHDDHGHDDHAHDHGHGDLHAEAHPDAHAPAEHVAHIAPVAAPVSSHGDHDHHDEHGHDAHDAHGHDAHGHDAHGHDAPSHDEHAADHAHEAHHDAHHGKELEHAHH